MKTMYGYKLFEENKGNLYPLFIGKNTPTPMGEWIHAEFLPTKGFAARGGWHIGDVPDAPWLKNASGEYSSRFAHGRRVWCVVEYNATNDYNEYVSHLPKKCMTDRVPENGYYFFREVGKGVWSITSDIRVVRKMDEAERQQVLKRMGYSEEKAFAKYKTAFEKRMKKK